MRIASKSRTRAKRAKARCRVATQRRLRVENLEDRRLLAGHTFLVDSFADEVDTNPGDGIAMAASGKTTLRAAIMEANASAGADTVWLPEGTYILSLAGTDEDAAATAEGLSAENPNTR